MEDEKQRTEDLPAEAPAAEVVVESPYRNSFVKKLDNLFGVTKAGSSMKIEIFAGIATFLAMCYILTVNPNQILYDGSNTSMWASLFIATAFGAIIGTLLMSFVAKMPYAQAPGMGLNSMVGGLWGAGVGAFSYSYTYSFQNAMFLVFISGAIFLALTLIPAGRDKETGRLIAIREKIFDGIPKGLRQAIPVGIGLFIAYIGFQNAGIINANQWTQVELVNFTNWSTGAPASAIVAFIGLIVIAVLSHFKVKGAVVIGILAATLFGMIPMGGYQVTNVMTITGSEGVTWAFWNNFADFFTGDVFLGMFKGGWDFSGVQVIVDAETGATAAANGFSLFMTCFMIVISFCMIDMFDTMGTITGCAARAGLIDADGKPINFDKCLYADAIATVAGSMLGTSTVTTFVESGAGVAVGGKTGMTALTVAVMFFLSIFLLPLFAMIPSAAAASALIYVGVLMMANVKNIDFTDIKVAVPAFLTIIIMPLGYSITAGIGIGILSYVIISCLCYVFDLVKYAMSAQTELVNVKPKFDISVVTLIVALLFCLYFFVPTVY